MRIVNQIIGVCVGGGCPTQYLGRLRDQLTDEANIPGTVAQEIIGHLDKTNKPTLKGFINAIGGINKKLEGKKEGSAVKSFVTELTKQSKNTGLV